MVLKTVTEAGFYDGQFLKPGASYEAKALEDMNKAELIEEATRLEIDTVGLTTKAALIAAITAKAES
ncbi:MAG: hypothetical protein DI589_22465 [Shinella sp.]|nr:MAG: hypothetical protein DI589_22465 [Shinella sp.]